ncbi:MAG: hypothetical protein EWV81_10875 [Microcystis aeruginosa Ma_SC_T_19800800_S464]|uniref:Uncharacterized protein n=1 Tax=Microcystis aeruginosa Ma_SC_T_19800800_S464 TaxID=2486257 RepID=A0A552DV64_MICAE|nr:MAG: hypothetical protein EWV81_10875 [Microcystis aeruginosa Ma_SC_T_19800800_S464]
MKEVSFPTPHTPHPLSSQEIIFIYSSQTLHPKPYTPNPTPYTPLPQWPTKVGCIEIKLAKIRQD